MPAVILSRIDHHVPDKGPQLEATTTALLVLATLFVFLRFAARFRRGLTYGADDWMMVLSLVLLIRLGPHLPKLTVPDFLLRSGRPQLFQYVEKSILLRILWLITHPVIAWGLGQHAADLPAENLVMVLKVCAHSSQALVHL